MTDKSENSYCVQRSGPLSSGDAANRGSVFTETKTLRELLLAGTGVLEQAGVPDAAYDAFCLMSFVSGMNRSQYFMHQTDASAGLSWVDDYERLIRKRAERIPLQQLLGSVSFMGYDFRVNEHVLCPRQDTETLVEAAFAELQKHSGGVCNASGTSREEKDDGHPENMEILDMCTGSGCIALSIYLMAKEKRIPVRVMGADLSEEALKIAEANNRELADGDVTLVHSDMFAAFDEERYDMILSNPPYIPSHVCEELMPEVKDHEPRMALDGRGDGLHFYRILMKEGPGHLKPGGYMALEIGFDQGEAVASMMKAAGFIEVRVIKDLAGLDRVVEGRM